MTYHVGDNDLNAPNHHVLHHTSHHPPLPHPPQLLPLRSIPPSHAAPPSQASSSPPPPPPTHYSSPTISSASTPPSTSSLPPSPSSTLSPNTSVPWTPPDPDTNPTLQFKTLSKLQSSLLKLKSSQFYSQFLSQLHSPQIQSGLNTLLSFTPQFHLIIYGIDSIDSFETPRLQLALAVLLYEQLKPQVSSIEVFDPLISATECAVIEGLGISVMRIDEGGRREVKVPTLFFMPHCEMQLYDNLLDANWGRDRLSRMVLLGNSFGGYGRYAEERRGLGANLRMVEEVGRRVIGSTWFVREVEVEVEGLEGGDDEFCRAFHSLSWHFFDVGSDADIDFV